MPTYTADAVMLCKLSTVERLIAEARVAEALAIVRAMVVRLKTKAAPSAGAVSWPARSRLRAAGE